MNKSIGNAWWVRVLITVAVAFWWFTSGSQLNVDPQDANTKSLIAVLVSGSAAIAIALTFLRAWTLAIVLEILLAVGCRNDIALLLFGAAAYLSFVELRKVKPARKSTTQNAFTKWVAKRSVAGWVAMVSVLFIIGPILLAMILSPFCPQPANEGNCGAAALPWLTLLTAPMGFIGLVVSLVLAAAKGVRKK